jgi:alkylation response protein AidB-like acyl-CoA dehydrogenase
MDALVDERTVFATEQVLPTLRERYEAGEFRRDLWREMGALGLLGMTVAEEYGGSGGTARELAILLREFTRSGCDLGLTLSWITHLALCLKSIESFGTEQQKKKYIPRLVSGEWVGAAAVSEPDTGAHPAGIRTTAVETRAGYRIDGSKLYITDGPVADILVVVTATGEDQKGQKELTAFLVESSAPGFQAKRMELNFLATSPHAEITFEGVEVGTDAMLGNRGDGHSAYSKAAFARERSFVVAAFPGLFAAAAGKARERFIEKVGSFDLKGTAAYDWVHHLSALEAYQRLTEQLVDDALNNPQRWRSSIDLLIYLGISYAKWSSWISEFGDTQKLLPSFPLDIILRDMKLVMVGEGLLLKQGVQRYITDAGERDTGK